jgi:hypothetical protein
MIVGPPLTKQPAEIVPWSVDFEDLLTADETILSVTFAAYNADGSSATSTLAEGSVAQDDTIYTQMVRAGVGFPPTVYLLEFEVVTSFGQKRHAEVKLEVAGLP